MKHLEDYNFNPSEKDIFTINENGEKIYQIFSWGKKYIISHKSSSDKILELEGYRGFIWSYKPPIIIPIIIFSFIIAIFSIFIGKYEGEMQQLILYITITFYSVFSLIYYLLIRKAIKLEDG